MPSKILLLLVLLSALFGDAWSEYKARFIQKDGRVIDRMNRAVTHTEAIGYTLFFAQHFDDDATFALVYRWYKNNIEKNDLALPGWKWGECDKNQWKMCDYNSASDGNLWIAYALSLMGEKHSNKAYLQESRALLKAIKAHQTIQIGGYSYLLPAERGFTDTEYAVINPSYLLFEIFAYFAEKDDCRFWTNLRNGAVRLLQDARFSPLALNPDWVHVEKKSGAFSLAKNNTFGYDAIRIPLNILRSDLDKETKERLLRPYGDFVDMMRTHPLGVVDLAEEKISLKDLSFGHLAIYIRIGRFYALDVTHLQQQLQSRIKKEHENYYAYSLYLFTTM